MLIGNLMEIDFEKIDIISATESVIYKFLLTEGGSQAHEIVKGTKIKRTTVLHALNQLEEKNLIIVTPGGRPLYSPSSPKMLMKLLNERTRNIEDHKSYLSEVLPELEGLYEKQAYSMNGKFYIGEKEVSEMFLSLLDEGEEIFLYVFNDKVNKGLGDFWKEVYRPKRYEKKVYEKAIRIFSDKKLASKINYLERKLSETIDLHEDFLKDFSMTNFQMDKKIIGNKLIFTYYKEEELIGYVLENEVLANSEKITFNLLWNFAKMLKKK